MNVLKYLYQLTYHVLNDRIISLMNLSYHLGSHHAIWECISPSMITSCYQWTAHGSCHQRAHHDNSQHIMTSRNTSCRITTHHVSCHLQTRRMGVWDMKYGAHIWFTHYTGWFMMFRPWNRMVYHTDIGHRVVYGVSPMEPDGLSHGHRTQMQGDDF